MITLRAGTAADVPRAAALYARVAYGGGIGPADHLLLAEDDSRLVGLLRLAPEEGVTVLRGMQVVLPYQRQGIGTRLLDAADAAIGPGVCYCIPYRHLTSFYGRIGFEEVEPARAPGFLAARLARYHAECGGPSFCIMLREGRQANFDMAKMAERTAIAEAVRAAMGEDYIEVRQAVALSSEQFARWEYVTLEDVEAELAAGYTDADP